MMWVFLLKDNNNIVPTTFSCFMYRPTERLWVPKVDTPHFPDSTGFCDDKFQLVKDNGTNCDRARS